MENITIQEYLDKKGIPYRESGRELITTCLFNDCDTDSKGNEAHLYFNKENGTYQCFKCSAKGNLVTLMKHFGDFPQTQSQKKEKSSKRFSKDVIEKCHFDLPDRIREYMNARGISNQIIDEFKIGYGKFYKSEWITIPIKDEDGNYIFFKLRQDPVKGNEKITSLRGVNAQIYGWDMLQDDRIKRIVICEGELDRLALLSNNIPAVTSTHGAMTFKEYWAKKISKDKEVYICFDNDEAGKNGANRTAELLYKAGHRNIHIITLPDEVGQKGDITDYIIKLKGDLSDLFGIYAKEYPEKIDISDQSEMSCEDLANALTTIKFDFVNKIIGFLCELSIYAGDAQFNLIFNAPSSTGKSYIPTEIAKLFPLQDVQTLAYSSPTAFFHLKDEYDEERGAYIVDLSSKILIFQDQPHYELLGRLRPILSHDQKESEVQIADRSKNAGNRTKRVILKGYPAVIYCTVGSKIDEQESTRFLILSPEASQEKIKLGVIQTIDKESDNEKYQEVLDQDPLRNMLKRRILAIKNEHIHDVKISSESREYIKRTFLEINKQLEPRHLREIRWFIYMVKSLALLNLWYRERIQDDIIADQRDIDQAFDLWRKLYESQKYGVAPYILKIAKEVIYPLWKEKNAVEKIELLDQEVGLTRQDILNKHYDVYGGNIDSYRLRSDILPMLEKAGIIRQENDPKDKRKTIVYVTELFSKKMEQKNDVLEVVQTDEDLVKTLETFFNSSD